MKTAYLDCSAGICGNMFLGALLDLGLPQDYLMAQLQTLNINLPEIKVHKVMRSGIKAVLFDVPEIQEHHHRHLEEIKEIINNSALNLKVKSDAIRCFQNLAQAEAKVHGTDINAIHFHEVGAVDAIIDIVGAAIGLEYFKFDQILVAPIRVGFGTVHCAHGEIPLPAPATAQLLSGFYIFGGELPGEWATPTGATLVKTFGTNAGGLPQLKLTKVGYGAGNQDRSIPNVLRIIVGESGALTTDHDYQVIIETNIDDMNPEFYGYLGEKLLEVGVRDYYFTAVYMKKNRPATQLTVITEPELVGQVETILFTETTTLGVRKSIVQRACMQRSEKTVSVKGRNVRVKLAHNKGKIIKYAPEYEDCLAIAKELALPLKDIYDEASHCAKNLLEAEDEAITTWNK